MLHSNQNPLISTHVSTALVPVPAMDTRPVVVAAAIPAVFQAQGASGAGDKNLLSCLNPDCDAVALPGNSFCTVCAERGFERLRAVLGHADAYPAASPYIPPRAVIRPRSVHKATPLSVREARLARRAKRRARTQKARLFLVGFSVMPGALLAGYFLPGLHGWAFVAVGLVSMLTIAASLLFLMMLTRHPHAMQSPPTTATTATPTGKQWRKARSKRPRGRAHPATRFGNQEDGARVGTDAPR